MSRNTDYDENFDIYTVLGVDDDETIHEINDDTNRSLLGLARLLSLNFHSDTITQRRMAAKREAEENTARKIAEAKTEEEKQRVQKAADEAAREEEEAGEFVSAEAADLQRKLNNAMEILRDSKLRREYNNKRDNYFEQQARRSAATAARPFAAADARPFAAAAGFGQHPSGFVFKTHPHPDYDEIRRAEAEKNAAIFGPILKAKKEQDEKDKKKKLEEERLQSHADRAAFFERKRAQDEKDKEAARTTFGTLAKKEKTSGGRKIKHKKRYSRKRYTSKYKLKSIKRSKSLNKN